MWWSWSLSSIFLLFQAARGDCVALFLRGGVVHLGLTLNGGAGHSSHRIRAAHRLEGPGRVGRMGETPQLVSGADPMPPNRTGQRQDEERTQNMAHLSVLTVTSVDPAVPGALQPKAGATLQEVVRASDAIEGPVR